MPYTYEYPHPAVTVDIIIFALHEEELKVLLIQRKRDPFKEHWAIPGGFVEINEGLEEAARRELYEETGVEKVFLEQLYTFGEPKRDPRERIISVAYYSLVRLDQHNVRADSDALNAAWFSVYDLPHLAFDHDKILDMAIRRLQGKVMYAPVIFEMLPPIFEIHELQRVYEIILRQKFDAASFRRRILGTGILTPVDPRHGGDGMRKKSLYRFDPEKYARMTQKGFTFEIKLQEPRKNRKGK